MSAQSGHKVTLKTVLMGMIGLLFIFAYFFFTHTSLLVKSLKPQVNQEEIRSLAESFFKGQPLKSRELEQDISARLDKNLLLYAQHHYRETGKFPPFHAGYWHIEWLVKERTRPGDREPFLGLDYDFGRNLIGFKINRNALDIEKGKNFSEDDAIIEARYFLEAHGIKAAPLVITSKDIGTQGDQINYRLTFKDNSRPYPGLIEKYTIEISGQTISQFTLEKVIDPQIIRRTDQDLSRFIGTLLFTVIWITLGLIMMVQFATRLRRDMLEFKRAFMLGIVIAICLFLFVVIRTHGNIVALLTNGGIAGVFGIILFLVLYPVAEAQCREVWPEKLTTLDLIFQGRFNVQEIGAAILHSHFLVGLTLLYFALLFQLTPPTGIAFITFPPYALGVFLSPINTLVTILKDLFLALLIGLTLLCFWPVYLKERLRHKTTFILILALTLNLAGIHTLFFNPTYISFLLVLPVALLWALAVYRYDFLTIFLSLMAVNFFLDLVLVLLFPQALVSLLSLIVLIPIALFFLFGLYLTFHKRSAQDYDSYVPGYVDRISQRERFLKELEIARSVQMRFLPQQVPQCPALEIVSLCQPALEVGGDYYDFIYLDERYMSILIGDVSGKGVSAAFYMTMIKGIIKTLARKIKEPALLLAEANEIFFENAPRDTFITVIYGVFDLQEEVLTFASAGHNPLIVWNKNTAKTEVHHPAGIALGLGSGQKYTDLLQEERIPLREGDIFVFYTDGVSEAMNADQDIFGQERLLQIIGQSAHLSPLKIEEEIIRKVAEFSGSAPQHDDFTMVIVKIREKVAANRFDINTIGKGK